MISRLTTLAAVGAIMVLTAQETFARNTSGVFGATVDEGEKEIEYRIAYDPDLKDFNQRVHYQQAVNGSVRLRGIVQTRATDDRDFDFDYVRAELLWQLTPDGNSWASGLRFDGRIRGDDRPALVAVNWTNQFKLSPRLSARAIAIAGVEIGPGHSEGVLLETRERLAYEVTDDLKLGVDIFNEYGSTAGIDDLEDQVHQIGPFASVDVGRSWNVYAGALFGATQASPDTELRLFIIREF